jgi:flagellar biosynthesis protein FliR
LIFVSFLKEKHISFEGISFKIIYIVVNSLEIIEFDEFLEKDISIPQLFEESIQFLNLILHQGLKITFPILFKSFLLNFNNLMTQIFQSLN